MASSSSTTKPFNIPWSCLISDDPQPAKTISSAANPKPPLSTQLKTFAQAVNNVCDIPLSQLPQPCIKGDRLVIEIPDDEYDAGVAACKHNLHGRILWPKGSSPLSVDSLRSKLAVLWKSLGRWGVTSLGKGFYGFTFTSLEDLRRVRSIGSWNLNPGFLKLFAWSPDFNPSLQQQSTAQVWIRIYGLAQEYWRQKIIFAIAGAVGSPICTDSITNKPMIERSFGHYVRVLVDLNLTQKIRNRILVERKGYAFFVDVEYENLPDYCTFCKCTGHYLEICNRNKDLKKDAHVKDQSVGKDTAAKAKMTYVPKQKEPEIVDLEDSTSKNVAPRNEDDIQLEREVNEALDMAANEMDQADASPDAANVRNDDEQSSDDSFVDATQTNEGNHAYEGSARMNEDENHTDEVHDEVVQNDINFLKQSWANMTDAGDGNNVTNSTNAADVNVPFQNVGSMVQSSPNEKITDEQGFIRVTSEASKRAQKTKEASSSRQSTRLKIGISKPSS